MKQKISDIFFDLDHTLWDFDKNSKLAFGRMFGRYGIDLDLEAFMTIYEPINFGYWKLYRDGAVTKAELRKLRFTDVFSRFNMTLSDTTIIEMEAAYISELPGSNHLFEGAEDTLDYLGKKYRLHIITNGFEEVQDKKLINSNIYHHFLSITTSEQAGKQKPHADIFHLAMRKAKSKPEHSLMIGDTFEADILGAEKVGMHTIYFNYRKEDIPQSYSKIDQLSELKTIL